jgi:hypothetical protein
LSVKECLGSIEGPELLGPGNELRQLRDVEDELVEELYERVAEAGGIDLGDEVLQVLAFPFVEKNHEDGKNGALGRW